MSAHRWVPVPLELGEEERGPLWRCAGCAATTKDPTPRLLDDCPAMAMFEDGAA